MKRALVIDILGATGSGKSYLLMKVRELLEREGFVVAVPMEDLQDIEGRTPEMVEQATAILKDEARIVLRTTATNRALQRGPN